MKRIISFVFCLLMVLSICACNTPTPTPGQENNSQENQVQYAQYNALFDTNNHISIRLDISHTELVKMQDDYYHYASFGSKSPIYRRGNLAITITKPTGEVLEWYIEDVGVRMKGNTSRNDFYSSQEGMYSLIHFKLSFQEMAQIVLDRLVYEGRLEPGIRVDITWHWDRFTIDDSYTIFEQEENN